MTARRPKLRRGFTLLEVMVAIAILSIALSAVFSAEAGAVRMAARARKLGWASMLVRCKMGEIEEQIAKEGFPAVFDEGEDNCCTDAEIDGFTCKWEIEPVTMPDQMFEPEEGEENAADSDGDPKTDSSDKPDPKVADTKLDRKGAKEFLNSTEGSKTKLDAAELLKDPKKLLGGGSTPSVGGLGLGLGMGGDEEGEAGGGEMDAIASMAMQYVYPILKPSFESQIRRATVTVFWKEGDAQKSFDVTQYLVAEQPIKLPDGSDPNALNEQQDSTGTDSTRQGSGPGKAITGGNTNQQPGLFGPRTDFGGLFGGGNK